MECIIYNRISYTKRTGSGGYVPAGDSEYGDPEDFYSPDYGIF